MLNHIRCLYTRKTQEGRFVTIDIGIANLWDNEDTSFNIFSADQVGININPHELKQNRLLREHSEKVTKKEKTKYKTDKKLKELGFEGRKHLEACIWSARLIHFLNRLHKYLNSNLNDKAKKTLDYPLLTATEVKL